jgi:hypothetical protein
MTNNKGKPKCSEQNASYYHFVHKNPKLSASNRVWVPAVKSRLITAFPNDSKSMDVSDKLFCSQKCPQHIFAFETLLYITRFMGIPDMTWHGSSNPAVPEVTLQMLLIRNQINLMIRRKNNLEAGLVEQSESV